MWSIKCDYLTNFEVRYEVIKRNSDKVISLRKADDIIKLGKESSGYYVIKDDVFIAIYLSDENLIIQFNEKRYNLSEGLLEIKVSNCSDVIREFVLLEGNQPIESIKYKRQVEFDCWSTEDDLDLFAWILMRFKEGCLQDLLQNLI